MSKRLNFAQQMDEVLKTLGPPSAQSCCSCLLRALFQRRAGKAVPVF